MKNNLRPALAMALFALFFLCAQPLFAVVKTWTGAVDNDFHEPGNWSPVGVPGEADDVVIDPLATVNLSATAHVESLHNDGAAMSGVASLLVDADFMLENGTVQGGLNISVGGDFLWKGGIVDGNVAITVSGAANLTDGDHTKGGAGNITLNGGGSWTGGNLRFRDGGGQVVIPATKVFTASPGSGVDLYLESDFGYTATASFHIEGVFEKTGDGWIIDYLPISLPANGDIAISNGGIGLRTGQSFAGEFVLSGNGILAIDETGTAKTTAFAGTCIINGTDNSNFQMGDNNIVTIASGAVFNPFRLVQYNGTLTLNTPATMEEFFMDDGILNGTANQVTCAATFWWGGGNIKPGKNIISNGGNAQIHSNNSKFLEGSIMFNGGGTWVGGTVILDGPVTFGAGQTFTFNANNGADFSTQDNSGSVTNNGVFEKTTTNFNFIGAFFTNNGIIKGGNSTHFHSLWQLGTIAPGNSPGILPLQTDFFSNTGKLAIEIGGPTPGTDHDRINITGDYILGGTVELDFINGYDPTIGTFVLLSYTGTGSGTLPILTCISGGCDLSDKALVHDAGAKTLSLVVGPLPVELVDFRSKQSGRGVELDWRTAVEINADRFEVEHSVDGADFKKIGWEKAVGGAGFVQNYGFIHENPAQGMNYYRLRSIDLDGKFEFSKVVGEEIRTGDIETHCIRPNPTSGVVQIEMPKGASQIDLFDGNGRRVFSQNLAGEKTGQFDFGQFAPGIYSIRILGTGVAEVVRLVKM